MKIECAVKGLQHMDTDFMNKKLDEVVAKYKADPTKTNVQFNRDNWSITYDEKEEKSVVVETKKEDKVLSIADINKYKKKM